MMLGSSSRGRKPPLVSVSPSCSVVTSREVRGGRGRVPLDTYLHGGGELRPGGSCGLGGRVPPLAASFLTRLRPAFPGTDRLRFRSLPPL
jgi:hypothetical protein